MKPKLSADELVRRFDAAGGRVYHYQGARRCYVSTRRVGSIRYGNQHNSLLQTNCLNDPLTEQVTVTAFNQAEHRLRTRAKTLPALEPRMADLGNFLEAIDARTLTRDQLAHAVCGWMFLLEVWCRTREAREAFLYESSTRLDEALRRFAPECAPIGTFSLSRTTGVRGGLGCRPDGFPSRTLSNCGL